MTFGPNDDSKRENEPEADRGYTFNGFQYFSVVWIVQLAKLESTPKKRSDGEIINLSATKASICFQTQYRPT